MIDYLEYCALQALCYIEYANFDNQAALNTNLTSDGFKQGGLGAGVTNLNWKRGNNGQDTDKAARVLRLGGGARDGSGAGSGGFDSGWVRSDSSASVGFFTTVKLD